MLTLLTISRACARRAGRLGPALACALLISLAVMPASAAPADQVSAVAPENLRCAGSPAPPLPGPGWTIEPIWAWQNLLTVEGVLGSGDGPYAVALDRQCN